MTIPCTHRNAAGQRRQRDAGEELTMHDSPPSSGIAECYNRVLIKHTQASLLDSGLLKYLWKEAIKYAMWFRNCTTTHKLDGKTAYKAFYGTKPVAFEHVPGPGVSMMRGVSRRDTL